MDTPSTANDVASINTSSADRLSRLLTVADDGYVYTASLDPGTAPEDEITGQSLRREETTERDVAIPVRHTDFDQNAEERGIRIFHRRMDEMWRARAPDVESGLVYTLHQRNVLGEQGQTIRDLEVLHNWSKETAVGEHSVQLNVIRHSPESVPHKQDTGHIRWIHCKELKLNLERFEAIFLAKTSKQLASGISGLTRRLLKRVRHSDEKDFFGGKFLAPAVMKYDGQTKAQLDGSPCTFFSFPYFSVQTHSPCTKEAGDASNHHVRTLLQSRYRLESTQDRDKTQSMLKLSRQEVQQCTRVASSSADSCWAGKMGPIIHVPQLWGLSVSGDVMMTAGPLTEHELRGLTMKTRTTTVIRPTPGQGPPLVNINVEFSGKAEKFQYPTDQCDWFFGLLSKQRQILRSLGKGEEDLPSTTATGKGPEGQIQGEVRYKFWTNADAPDNSLVTIHNWLDVLRSENSEMLQLWMKPEMKPEIPEVVVTSAMDTPKDPQQATSPTLAPQNSSAIGTTPTSSTAGGSSIAGGTSGDAHSHSISAQSTTANTTTSNANSIASVPSLQSTQSFFSSPLLEWELIDDFGETDPRTKSELVTVFLEDCHTTLLSRYRSILQGSTSVPVAPVASTTPDASATFPLEPCSFADLQAQVAATENDRTRSLCQAMILYSVQLLRYFISDNLGVSTAPSANIQTRVDPSVNGLVQAHPCLRLHWGVLKWLVFYFQRQSTDVAELEEIITELKDICRAAERIHMGMQTLRIRQRPGRTGATGSTSASGRVLLGVMVEALQSIFYVHMDAAKHLRTKLEFPSFATKSLESSIHKHVKDSIRFLETAEIRLIAEVDDLFHDKELGPVVTPEAIIILLLDRLSQGVYGDGTVDILELYEKIVEKMALAIESKASRRFLLKIDRISEELNIVDEVLRQQRSVLSQYRQSLDPTSYKTLNPSRQMNFAYESSSLNRIMQRIQDKITDCGELSARAKRLADQNVRLVETQDDDNGKAIMVFTVITVIFLPLSFATGYFGMNLKGIGDTTQHTGHFWEIAAPLTFGVVVICVLIAYSSALKRWVLRTKRKKKTA